MAGAGSSALAALRHCRPSAMTTPGGVAAHFGRIAVGGQRHGVGTGFGLLFYALNNLANTARYGSPISGYNTVNDCAAALLLSSSRVDAQTRKRWFNGMSKV
jgi:hypothetical protein